MKIIATADPHNRIKMTKEEWYKIGVNAGWYCKECHEKVSEKQEYKGEIIEEFE